MFWASCTSAGWLCCCLEPGQALGSIHTFSSSYTETPPLLSMPLASTLINVMCVTPQTNPLITVSFIVHKGCLRGELKTWQLYWQQLSHVHLLSTSCSIYSSICTALQGSMDQSLHKSWKRSRSYSLFWLHLLHLYTSSFLTSTFLDDKITGHIFQQ